MNNSTINSKYDYILNSSRVLTIPVVKLDDQILNAIIKQKRINKIDHCNDHQVQSQIRTLCKAEEKVKTIDTKIKVKKDFMDGYGFQGLVTTENHSSELSARMNSDKISNLQENHQKCDICNLSFNNM